MLNDKENIIVCDCEAEEVEAICNVFNKKGQIFSVKSHIANWKRSGKLSEIKRYLKYFGVAFHYFASRRKYKVIIGWQQFYALIFCFYSSVFHTKKRNTVVALNYTYRDKSGKFGKLYKWFMKKCLNPKYLDYIHVPSQNYAQITSELFGFPIENIIVSPFGINDPWEQFSELEAPGDAPTEGYVLSIGRSNRDYDFLIEAWRGIDYPLVIISDTYGGDNKGNSNIRIIRNIAGEQSYPWIAHCNAMIIPIDDGTICSGDTVLLTSLAMKKKVLITSPSTLSEMYIEHEVNGLCSEKDAKTFSALVNHMIFTDQYDYIQDHARESYLKNYSRQSMGEKIHQFVFDMKAEI